MTYNNSNKQLVKQSVVLFFLFVSPFVMLRIVRKQLKNTFPLKVKYTLLLMWISIGQN